ncbi:MAG: hypothetical protein KIS86_09245 [Devosia sp.]|nr:hypothetical protein [Devosia sp.]
MLYPYALITHLLCAIAFIGVVFFEVFMLEGMRPHLGHATMEAVEAGLVRRARQIMPYVVGLLFLSGAYLGYEQFSASGLSWSNSLSVLLSIKIALALSVLAHFISAMRAAGAGCMSSDRFRRTHISVFIHMVLIVILAKSMFYFTW